MKKRVLSILALVAGLCFTAQAAGIYWNGVGTNWSSTADWSTASGATTPNPAAVPGASDTAIFNITTVNSAQAVSMNANRSVLGLTFNNTGTTTIQGGGSDRTLTLGAGGITINSGAGAVTFAGGGTAGQRVAIALSANQTWTNNSSSTFTKTGANAANAISLGTNQLTFAGTGSGSWSLGSPISGTGSLVVDTAGTVALSAANGFTGGTTLNNGTLSVYGNNTALGTGTLTINGGTFTAANTGARNYTNAVAIGGNFTLQGGGTTSGTNNVELSGIINLGGATRTITTFSGFNNFWILSGNITNGGLIKAGSNKLVLSGANTYTGATTVAAGTLAVEGSLASDVTVQNGATLSGTGTLKKVTLDAGAILAAGNSPGTMTFTDNVLMSAGSTNNMEITDTAHDILMGSGANTLTMDGTTVFDFTGFTGGVTNGYTIALSDMFVSWGSINTNGATYSAVGLSGGQSLDFTGGVLTVIPEPATIGMLGLGALVTLMIRRIRNTH